MNGDELLETFRKLRSQPGAISDHAADEMILAGIVDVRNAVAEVSGKVGKVSREVKKLKENDIAHLSADVKDLKKNWEENPSLLYLLRYKTTATIRLLLVVSAIVVFGLLTIWFNPDFQTALLELLNISHVDPIVNP